jgi:hypothetical protein
MLLISNLLHVSRETGNLYESFFVAAGLTIPNVRLEGGGAELDLDALLIALLKKILSPDKGWPAAQRVRWFRTFAMNVSQIYDEDDQPVEMKIEELKEAAN